MGKRRRHFKLISCHVMWRELQRLIDESDNGSYDAILLGYGLCGNGTRGLKTARTPLVMMRGHDCISFLLGSGERFREINDSIPGIYWYSPGWIDNDKVPGREQDEKIRRELSPRHPQERVEQMIDLYWQSIKNYSHGVLVDQGSFDTTFYDQYTRRNAEYSGLRYKKVQGDPALMRDFLSGRWDDQRFLVLPHYELVQGCSCDKTDTSCTNLGQSLLAKQLFSRISACMTTLLTEPISRSR